MTLFSDTEVSDIILSHHNIIEIRKAFNVIIYEYNCDRITKYNMKLSDIRFYQYKTDIMERILNIIRKEVTDRKNIP